MKRAIIFTLLAVLMATAALAEKTNELLNSYNFKRGMELMGSSSSSSADLEAAFDCFQKEVAEHPKNGYAYCEMGIIYDQKEQHGLALECYNTAIGLLKKDKTWLAFAYSKRGYTYQQLEKDDLALADWKLALKANPKDYNTLCLRARFYYDHDDYDLSDADYDKIIKIKPGLSIGYNGKGSNAFARKDYEKAIDYYNYAISIDPTNGTSYAGRAQAYLELKRFNEAADDVISAYENGEQFYSWYLLSEFKDNGKDILLAKLRIKQAKDKYYSVWSWMQGQVYESNNMFEEAIDAYQAANGINPQATCYKRIANCQAELGQYNKALSNIDIAFNMDSTNTSCLRQKADYLQELGLERDALAVINTYIDKEPDAADGYDTRGSIKAQMGDEAGAIEDFTTSLVLIPDDGATLIWRANCYMKQGNRQAAMADYKRVTEVDTLYTTYDHAQYAYLALGDRAKAIAVQDSILANNPDDAGCYYDAACLNSKMGNPDSAMHYLKLAIEKGYRQYNHIQRDEDLNSLRDRADFKALMKELKALINPQPDTIAIEGDEQEAAAPPTQEMIVDNDGSAHVSEIPFTRIPGGLCKVKCNINGLPLNFWLDTGASNVSMSQVEATFMFKNGYLTADDVVGSAAYYDANGNVNVGTVLNLRNVKFGDAQLTNVQAGVVGNQRAPLLLGQSVLARLGAVEVDNAKKVIRIKYYK